MSERKKSRKRRIFIVLIVFLIILAVACGTVAGYIFSKLSKVNYVKIDEEKIEVNEGVKIGDEYKNFAILGLDSRENSFSNTRSDCIIIVSLNQNDKTIKLVSVYRDTSVDINGSIDKITHAYAYGGPELALSTLNKNLDLNISKFVAVNFRAVIDFIDAVGGVEMEVTDAEAKNMIDYINEINNIFGLKIQYVTGSGRKLLNGGQALAYSRIRYTEGGDYKRTERMRDVITAGFNKAKKMNITKINSLMDKLLPEVHTNVESMEILSLVPQVLQFNIDESIGWPYEVRGVTINNVWYGAPVTLESCVKKLHQEVFGEEEYEPSKKVKSISNTIIKKTGAK